MGLYGPYKVEEKNDKTLPSGLRIPISDREFMVQQLCEVRHASDAIAHRFRNQIGTNECYVTEGALKIAWEFLRILRDCDAEEIVRSFFFNEYCFRLVMNID